jgi:hypothetical protein
VLTLHSAKDLADGDIAGKSDAYVKVDFIEHESKHTDTPKKTSVISDSLNPAWEETLVWLVDDKLTRLKLHVMDKDLLSSDTLGSVMVLLDSNKVRQEVALDPKGTITISVTILPIGVAAGLAHSFMIPAGFAPKIVGPYNRLLVTTVQHAKVKNADFFGKSDPYVFIQEFTGGKSGHQAVVHKAKGPVHDNDLAPVFNETYANLIAPEVTGVKIQFYDDDVGADKELGYYNLSTASRVTAGTFPLVSSGEVTLNAAVVPYEVIICAASAVQPFISTVNTPIKTGAGWKVTAYYCTAVESVVEITALIDGKTPVAQTKQVVPASKITSATLEMNPSSIIPVGKHITLQARLCINGAMLSASSTIAASLANVTVS